MNQEEWVKDYVSQKVTKRDKEYHVWSSTLIYCSFIFEVRIDEQSL